MGLVDERRNIARRLKLLVRPLKLLARIPDGGAEVVRLFILGDVRGIQRDAVLGAPGARDGDLHVAAVAQRAHAAQLNLPIAVAQCAHGMALAVPAVEIANQVHGRGARRPLAVHPPLGGLVKAVVKMAAGKLAERLPRCQQLALALAVMAQAFIQIPLKGGEIGIVLKNLQFPRAFLFLIHLSALLMILVMLIVPYFFPIFNTLPPLEFAIFSN